VSAAGLVGEKAELVHDPDHAPADRLRPWRPLGRSRRKDIRASGRAGRPGRAFPELICANRRHPRDRPDRL
jgi:hypothetical protein